MPEIFWRVLFNYFNASSIVVKYDHIKSNPFKITDGVKQGGIFLPYMFNIMFNIYVNYLLYACTGLNCSCKKCDFNMSIVAKCDIILSSSSKAGLQSCWTNLQCFLQKCNVNRQPTSIKDKKKFYQFCFWKRIKIKIW